MGIEKMVLVNIVGDMKYLDGALDRCCKSGCFHMEPALSKGSSGKSGLEMLSEKNPYTNTLRRLEELCRKLSITPTASGTDDDSFKTLYDFESYIDSLENEVGGFLREKQECYKEISEKGAAVKQLNHLKGMNTNFEQIFSCEYTHIRLGKLPIESYSKLEYYDEVFFFIPFDKDSRFYWGMYFCAEKDSTLIDEIFQTLYFERIFVPDFVQGTPEKAFEELNDVVNRRSLRVEEIDEELARISAKRSGEILRVYSQLKFRESTFNLRRNVASVNGKFYIKGFVPKPQAEGFKRMFEGLRTASVTLLPPDSEPDLTPPTKLKSGWFSRPYISVVEMHGVPAYDGLNPTAFVALSFTLLFGIMFGDLGQGAVVFLLGLFMSLKLKNKFGGLLTRCGLSSMIFGFIYGSFFGYEHFLDPVYEAIGLGEKPLEIFDQTTFILISAVAIGAVIIVISMLLNIITGFKQHDVERAVFGSNGIAGLVFYGSVLGIVVAKFSGANITTPVYIIFLIVVPLVCIFCRVPFSAAVKYRQWRLSEDPEEGGIGNFIVENFFEMFEYLLSYVSNTLSFLRVGGFVLCHAGMMLVVMTLMDMFSGAGQPIVLVVGNIFVMAMEGMIVAIQLIRLEFYEVFSRFYDGDGKPFTPVGSDMEINTSV